MGQEVLGRPNGIRCVRIEITPEMVLALLKIPETGLVVNGMELKFGGSPIPDSAKALRAGINEYGNIQLLVEDDSFGLVGEGCVIPRLDPIYYQELPSGSGSNWLPAQKATP